MAGSVLVDSSQRDPAYASVPHICQKGPGVKGKQVREKGAAVHMRGESLGGKFRYNVNPIRPRHGPDIVTAKRLYNRAGNWLLVVENGICL
jgi:hypothetical protein